MGQKKDQVAMRLHFRAGSMMERLERGPGSPAVVAKRDLQRYYQLVDECLTGLGLSESEAGLLTEAAAGLRDLDEPARTAVHRYLWAEVADAIRERDLEAKWGVDDPHELVQRIRNLAPAEQRALIDALERFWAIDEAEELADRLRTVGLVAAAEEEAE